MSPPDGKDLPNPYDDLDIPGRPRISRVPSALRVEIPENAPCIVIETGIGIYSANPQEARCFQRLWKAFGTRLL